MAAGRRSGRAAKAAQLQMGSSGRWLGGAAAEAQSSQGGTVAAGQQRAVLFHFCR